MKAIKRTTDAQSFITGAANGETVVAKSKATKTGLTNVIFTEKQWIFIDKVKALSGISNYSALFNVAIEFMKGKGFNYEDYTKYAAFLLGDNQNSKRLSFKKDSSYFFAKEIYEKLKSEWINIRIRGVLLMALLHYTKKELKSNLDDFL